MFSDYNFNNNSPIVKILAPLSAIKNFAQLENPALVNSDFSTKISVIFEIRMLLMRTLDIGNDC